MDKKKLQIGVIGSAGNEEYPDGNGLTKESIKKAQEVGKLLAQAGAIVVTGGKGGIMEAASRGAKEENGLSIGVIQGKKRFTSNDFVNIEILSGAEADGLDEYLLVMMCDALIAIGGGAGTLQEIVIAYRNNKPVIMLEGTGGWADKLEDSYLDDREKIEFIKTSIPKEAVDLAIKNSQNHHNKAPS